MTDVQAGSTTGAMAFRPAVGLVASEPGPQAGAAASGDPAVGQGLYCDRRGQGAPLLLLHGLGGTSRSWAPIIDGLAHERTVLALDLPGSGRTRLLAVPLTIAHLADQVAAFLARRKLVGIDVVGFSTGARLALELARRGVVGTTVALDPAGFSRGWRRRLFHWSATLSIGLLRRLRPALLGLVGRASARALLLWPVSPRPWRIRPEVLREELAHYAVSAAADELLHTLSHGPPPLGSARHPDRRIVIGWGRRDRICPPSQSRAVLDLFPTADLHWFENAGHNPLWDCPDEVTRLILQATGGQPSRTNVSQDSAAQ